MASSVGNVADSTGTGVRTTLANALLLSCAVLCLSSPTFPPAISMTSVHCWAYRRLPAPNGVFRFRLLRKHFLLLPLLFASFLTFQSHKGPSFPLSRDASVTRARLEYFRMDCVGVSVLSLPVATVFFPNLVHGPSSSPFSYPFSSPLLPFLLSLIWFSCQSMAGVLFYIIISSLCITQGWAKAPRCAASYLKKKDIEKHPAGQCLTGVPSVEQPQFRLEISRGSFCQRAIPPAAPAWISHPALPPLPRRTTPFLPSCSGQPNARFLPLGRNHPGAGSLALTTLQAEFLLCVTFSLYSSAAASGSSIPILELGISLFFIHRVRVFFF